MSLVDDIGHVLAPPHPAGRPFILGGLIAVLLGLLIAAWLAWLGLLFTLACLFFFRDPERVAPGRPRAVIAPADGRVVSVTPAVPPAELGLGATPRWRISTFLSVLDVHVNRIPADGIITRIAYRHGSFSTPATTVQKPTNATPWRCAWPMGEIVVVQIAGLIARRIVCDLRQGDQCALVNASISSASEPGRPVAARGAPPLVAVGQTMIGGET